MAERTGAERIVDERRRQIEKERWSAKHDDEHVNCELAIVAALYAAASTRRVRLYERFDRANGQVVFADPWPETWDDEWDKRVPRPNPQERLRMLEKAGALIAAEIDRLLRKEHRHG